MYIYPKCSKDVQLPNLSLIIQTIFLYSRLQMIYPLFYHPWAFQSRYLLIGTWIQAKSSRSRNHDLATSLPSTSEWWARKKSKALVRAYRAAAVQLNGSSAAVERWQSRRILRQYAGWVAEHIPIESTKTIKWNL